MNKISVFIDGFNLYHHVKALGKNHLKWADPCKLASNFLHPENDSIKRVLFFTAEPTHTPPDVQQRYHAFTQAIAHFGAEIIEGKFKKKIITYTHKGQKYTRPAHEEKETDVNLALAILEDAYECISDKIIVITNDSDIAPAIRLAKIKRPELAINVVTPPLVETKRANYDLMDACGAVNKNKKGQVFFKQRMIKEQHLIFARMPEIITLADGTIIQMPKEYKLPI